MIKHILLSCLLAPLLLGYYPVFAGSGGPDAYGYTWIDSDEFGGPAFSWVDITASGTLVSGLADDNAADPLDFFGWNFPFYWTGYSELVIGSNGWISFDPGLGNIGSCFPGLPAVGSGDLVICPFMSDLTLDGASNPGRVYYLYDGFGKLIISYHNVPFWSGSAPLGYVGSNTFQVIMDQADSSITFQYKEMSAGALVDIPGCEVDLVIGIESDLGMIGLEHSRNAVPSNNYAVKFSYPEIILDFIADPTPDWVGNPDNGGFFTMVDQPVNLAAKIQNRGNIDQTAGAVNTVLGEVRTSIGISLYTNTQSFSALEVGDFEVVTFSPAYVPSVPGSYYFLAQVSSSEDDISDNNSKQAEMVVVEPSGCTAILGYSSGSPPGLPWFWGDPDTLAVEFRPPGYPVTINALDLFLFTNSMDPSIPGSFEVRILDDDGPDGSPGTVLATQSLGADAYTGDAWVNVTLDSPVEVSEGSVFAAYYWGGDSALVLGRETFSPISNRSWRYHAGSWKEYYLAEVEELFMDIRVDVCSINAEKPLAESWVEVYPNPVSEYLNVHLSGGSPGPVRVKLSNLMGQTVRSTGKSHLSEVRVPVGGLPGGVYLVEVRKGNQVSAHKVLIQSE